MRFHREFLRLSQSIFTIVRFASSRNCRGRVSRSRGRRGRVTQIRRKRFARSIASPSATVIVPPDSICRSVYCRTNCSRERRWSWPACTSAASAACSSGGSCTNLPPGSRIHCKRPRRWGGSWEYSPPRDNWGPRIWWNCAKSYHLTTRYVKRWTNL